MRGENLRPDSSPWDPEVLAGFCSHLGNWDNLLKEAKSNLGMPLAEGRDCRNSMEWCEGGEAAE